MTDMDTAHRRDYEAKQRMEDVRAAIGELLGSDAAIGRLSLSERAEMTKIRTILGNRCDQIVSAWN